MQHATWLDQALHVAAQRHGVEENMGHKRYSNPDSTSATGSVLSIDCIHVI